jgi:hypothetical protein
MHGLNQGRQFSQRQRIVGDEGRDDLGFPGFTVTPISRRLVKLIFYTSDHQGIDCKRQLALKKRLGATFG